MSLLWEFVVEGFLSLDGHEDFSNKIEDVWATIVIACLALAYPTYKGLSIIRNWKELEKTLINQEMQSVLTKYIRRKYLNPLSVSMVGANIQAQG